MFLDWLEPFQPTTSLGIAHAALLMVFRTKDEVETFLQFGFGKNLEDISSTSETRPKILEKMLLDADANGYFVPLMTKAKEKFPDNNRFQQECDKALAEKRKEDGGNGVPIEQRARSPQLSRNLKWLALLVVVGGIWSGLVMGLEVPFAVLSALGTLWGSLVALYKYRPWLGGRIDRGLVRLLSHPKTSFCLIGLLALSLGASLFVGSLVIEQGDVETSSLKAAFASGRTKPQLISTKKRHYFLTTPWSGRKLNLHLDGFLAHPSTICPWRTTKAWLATFEPAPYVLLIPSEALTEDINVRKPWRVTIRVEPAATTHELLSYYGEPILIGQEDDPPQCIRPKGTLHQSTLCRMIHPGASPQHPVGICPDVTVPSCPNVSPGHVSYSTVQPPIALKPGMELSVKWQHPKISGWVYCDTLTVEPSKSAGVAIVQTLKNDCR